MEKGKSFVRRIFEKVTIRKRVKKSEKKGQPSENGQPKSPPEIEDQELLPRISRPKPPRNRRPPSKKAIESVSMTEVPSTTFSPALEIVEEVVLPPPPPPIAASRKIKEKENCEEGENYEKAGNCAEAEQTTVNVRRMVQRLSVQETTSSNSALRDRNALLRAGTVRCKTLDGAELEAMLRQRASNIESSEKSLQNCSAQPKQLTV